MKADISELQYAQGDVVRAIQTISRYNLPLTTAGADECERLMREAGEGNRTYWDQPAYLRSTIHMAQGVLEQIREPQ